MAHRRTMGGVCLDESTSQASVASPIRRKSLAATPQLNISTEINQNDDEREILARRRLPTALESSMNTESSERRVSLGLVAGLSSKDIMEHYNKCVKLCAENKITVKNAFGLSMIDYLAVLNKRDASSNNMQTAGTTLDVSTKIYGLRVDCIHTEVFKMAGDPENRENKDGEADNAQDVANSTNPAEPEVRQKKKRVAQKILCTTESLSSKPELLNLCLTNKNSDTQTTDTLFQVTFPVHVTSGHSLHLYEDILLDFVEDKGDGNRKEHPELEIVDVEDFTELVILPMFEDFDIIGWSEDDIPESPSPPQSPAAGGLRFDLDASIANVCEDDGAGMNYFDLDDASQENVDRCVRGPNEAEKIVDFRELVSSKSAEKDKEYSYLYRNVNNLHWAGPVHWKPKLFPKAQGANRVVNACHQESAKKKKEVLLDCTVELVHTIVDKVKSKISKKLQPKTVCDIWEEDKLTLPEDVHYDGTNAIKFYYYSSKTMPLIPLTKPNNHTGANNDTAVLEDGVNYDYDNLNDTQDYCSQNNNAGEFEGENNSNGFDDNQDQDQDENRNPNENVCSQTLTGSNLVAAPKAVTQIHLQYSTRAKKIDMRQLKRGIWKSLIMQSGGGDPAEEPCRDSSALIKDEHSFSSVYKNLRRILGKETSEALSPALAFTSLLHLANEKTLNIASVQDMSDLKISQG